MEIPSEHNNVIEVAEAPQLSLQLHMETKHSKLWYLVPFVAHFCILIFVAVIIYICVTINKFVLFTWHPLLLSVGWALLMSEAILAISKDSLVRFPKQFRVRLHWISQTIGVCFILIGFLIVYINKDKLNKNHFTSWHGLFGLLAIIGVLPTCLNGIVALYHFKLRQYIRPKLTKFIHISSGILTYGFGGITLILSVYTKWFERNAGDIVFRLCVISIICFIICVLVRPLMSAVHQIKHLLYYRCN